MCRPDVIQITDPHTETLRHSTDRPRGSEQDEHSDDDRQLRTGECQPGTCSRRLRNALAPNQPRPPPGLPPPDGTPWLPPPGSRRTPSRTAPPRSPPGPGRTTPAPSAGTAARPPQPGRRLAGAPVSASRKLRQCPAACFVAGGGALSCFN